MVGLPVAQHWAFKLLIQLPSTLAAHDLRGPILIDPHGIPRYWATVWSTLSTAQVADSTHIKKLRCIESLYQHADDVLGTSSLDDALGTLDDDALTQILESWFVSLRNRASGTKNDEVTWQTGSGFVFSVIAWLSKSVSDDRILQIERRLHRLKTLYGQLHVRRTKSVESVRSLPSSTVEALYTLLDPSSEKNPFTRQATRWRMFVAFVLMLHQGLRRGEVLLLPTDAVKSAFDRRHNKTKYWLNISENDYEKSDLDPRYSKPSIKTTHSIRQIPVSQTTADIIDTYVQNYRGRASHSYLLNSHTGMPLSTEALTKAFVLLTENLPTQALKELRDRTGKISVTPHDLRHTCAVVRLHQLLRLGDEMPEALQKLRTFFGWSKTSSMPSRYARAVFEDRLAHVWNDAFDERVSLLRSLPKGH